MNQSILILTFSVLFLHLTACKEFKETEYIDDFDYEQYTVKNVEHKNDKADVSFQVPTYDLRKAPELFNKFISDYNKKYKDDEDYNKHFKQFTKKVEDINRMNSEGNGDAVFDINMFADLSDEEFASFLGYVFYHLDI